MGQVIITPITLKNFIKCFEESDMDKENFNVPEFGYIKNQAEIKKKEIQ